MRVRIIRQCWLDDEPRMEDELVDLSEAEAVSAIRSGIAAPVKAAGERAIIEPKERAISRADRKA